MGFAAEEQSWLLKTPAISNYSENAFITQIPNNYAI